LVTRSSLASLAAKLIALLCSAYYETEPREGP
jgi:hypothetical protein